MSASASAAAVLETQRTLDDIDSLQLLLHSFAVTKTSVFRPFSALTSATKITVRPEFQNKLIINASHIAKDSRFPLFAHRQPGFRVMTHLISPGSGIRHHLVTEPLYHKVPDVKFTRMLSVNQVLYKGIKVDFRRHVSSCFSLSGKDKTICPSCCYNYFCSSPFSVPSLSLSCSQSQPRPECRSPRTRR